MELHTVKNGNFFKFVSRSSLKRRKVPVRGMDLRFWAVRSYLVVYSERAVPLQIVAIFHGARDIPSIPRNV